MAVIGMSIGMAFALSLVAAPLLDGIIGVQGIFWMTSVLAMVGVGMENVGGAGSMVMYSDFDAAAAEVLADSPTKGAVPVMATAERS